MNRLDERLGRRAVLGGGAAWGGSALMGLGGCAAPPNAAEPQHPPRTTADRSPDRPPQLDLAPLRARVDRIFDITVCLRPFRAAGPRLDAEQVGKAFVVHNYGHGGSGWSLSWGSGAAAVRTAMSRSPRKVAVIGCGALGLTSAILAQEAGAAVTIYTRDLLPDTPSSRATGSWTPDSRIALTDAAGPSFPDQWEQMARASFKRFRRYLGLPGDPVAWFDRYFLSDDAMAAPPPPPPPHPALDFAHYFGRLRDITPRVEVLDPRDTPFPVDRVRRQSQMMFNIAPYAHGLLTDFRLAGGRIVRREFHSPAEIARLPENVVINCVGYGARALWRDDTVVPVRGQVAWLLPQPDVSYGVFYRAVSMVPRRDGIVVQAVDGGDMKGFGETDEAPDRAEAEGAVLKLAEVFDRFGQRPRRNAG